MLTSVNSQLPPSPPRQRRCVGYRGAWALICVYHQLSCFRRKTHQFTERKTGRCLILSQTKKPICGKPLLRIQPADILPAGASCPRVCQIATRRDMTASRNIAAQGMQYNDIDFAVTAVISMMLFSATVCRCWCEHLWLRCTYTAEQVVQQTYEIEAHPVDAPRLFKPLLVFGTYSRVAL